MLTRPDKMKLHTLLGSYPNVVALKDGQRVVDESTAKKDLEKDKETVAAVLDAVKDAGASLQSLDVRKPNLVRQAAKKFGSDKITIAIDTAKNAIVETIRVIAPASILPSPLGPYTGANSNSVTLSPDGKLLAAAL